MLTEKQIAEIKEHLDNAKNPVFYYDNDSDGLCSFILLRRYLDRGKGVVVRSFPDLDKGYARKAIEFNSDYIFILDKHSLSKEFLQEIKIMNLPIVWIDHHEMPIAEFEKDFPNLHVYNPSRNSGKNKSNEPTTFLTYKITNRKEDIWLAMVGCLADHYLPEFSEEFEKRFSNFWGKINSPFEGLYKTEIGKIARILNFALKDSITNVIKLQNFLISAKNPEEVFLEEYSNYPFRRKYLEINKKYLALLERAKSNAKKKEVIFEYSGELSISSDLSNELCYIYPEKHILVAYKNGEICNISLRGKNVRKILSAVLKKVEGSGGGHEDAVGARIKTSDLEKFKSSFLEETKLER